jgi:hypothetical protein
MDKQCFIADARNFGEVATLGRSDATQFLPGKTLGRSEENAKSSRNRNKL